MILGDFDAFLEKHVMYVRSAIAGVQHLRILC